MEAAGAGSRVISAAMAVRLRHVAAELVALAEELEQRPARQRRVAAPRPDPSEMASRHELWATFQLLSLERGRVVTKLTFAVEHGIVPGEFGRWLSGAAKKWIATGSSVDLRSRAELTKAIEEVESIPTLPRKDPRPRPMGNSEDSQRFTTLPQ